MYVCYSCSRMLMSIDVRFYFCFVFVCSFGVSVWVGSCGWICSNVLLVCCVCFCVCCFLFILVLCVVCFVRLVCLIFCVYGLLRVCFADRVLYMYVLCL